ncbi:MAG: hypothetical protein J0M20_01070 [Burkholderiales bacterium]|nr:hypothetical protein [Burkholderiales bacterium]
MSNETTPNADAVRRLWQEQGVTAAESLYQARETTDDIPRAWRILGVELAVARADLSAVTERWLGAWAAAEHHPALRRTLVECLWLTPWDHELAPLWQRVAEAPPGKSAWRKAQVERGLAVQHLTGSRALMADVGDADTGGEWGAKVVALWAGQGDEGWAAAWLSHLDHHWLLTAEAGSNRAPDAAAFKRLEHWVQEGQAAVIEAWRKLTPAGAWADWLDLAAVVARWRAGDALWSVCLAWPDSVLRAWPKPIQRQAMARLALLAEQKRWVSPLGPAGLAGALSRVWPSAAAQHTAAQIELGLLRSEDADAKQRLDWFESRAGLADLRAWWAPRALHDCLRCPEGLTRWWRWCKQHGQPPFGPGPAGHDALVALCMAGRVPAARALLNEWRGQQDGAPSMALQAWLAVGEITVAQAKRQPHRAWKALNGWWQSMGLLPLSPAADTPSLTPPALLDSAKALARSSASPALGGEVTAIVLWPSLTPTLEDPDSADPSMAANHAVALLTLRSLLRQDAPGLSILIVTDHELPDVRALADSGGPAVQMLQVAPGLLMPERINAAVAAARSPWLIWARPGSVWHPQAVQARQRHLASRPQAQASQPLRLALGTDGAVSFQTHRSGLPEGFDGFLVRTDLLRSLPPLKAGQPDGWAHWHRQISRQLGAARLLDWPCTMGLMTLDTSASRPPGALRRSRSQKALRLWARSAEAVVPCATQAPAAATDEPGEAPASPRRSAASLPKPLSQGSDSGDNVHP